MKANDTHYEVNGVYPVTEVLGWWCQGTMQNPAWFPAMGDLHHDKDFFEVDEMHYHIDPRFLDSRFDAVTASHFAGTPWHRTYHEVMVFFAAADHPSDYLVVTDNEGILYRRGNHGIIATMTPGEGRQLVQTRVRNTRCLHELPPAPLSDEPSASFRLLREQYEAAEGDICPHKGYDLTSVPIDADGYRQCPLHQLMVRAPRREREHGQGRTLCKRGKDEGH